MTDAGLCHGWAGLLQVTLLVAWESGDERLADAAGELAARLLADHADDAPFGFRYAAGAGARVAPDRPGLLYGAAGIALALHAYATETPPGTTWDAALLLA